MNIPAFTLSALPRLIFGDGVINQVPTLIGEFGHKALLITGSKSFTQTPHWQALTFALHQLHIDFEHTIVDSEPSPTLVDELAAHFREHKIDVVVGIGGGSVLDAAKAVAGLLNVKNSVMDFLEGVGPELPYLGPALPFIAVPTTAGTGSEATKNAVLSQPGLSGFKKSFRHEKLVPHYAVVDPELLESCPPALIAANGMDAFTQLLESYTSLKANPLTDALALSGMVAVRDSLLALYHGEGDLAQHRRALAYAATLSGITLAQVGLGAVHGLAAPLGAFFSMPHGMVCGTLVAACTEANIHALENRAPKSQILKKYAQLGRVLLDAEDEFDLPNSVACKILIDVLKEWTKQLHLPRLSSFGMSADDIAHVVQNCRGSSMKTNPMLLTDAEVAEILRKRL
ncbi:MAG: iron-containing alcohol dehydrogenase [Methylophilaceae bacterium]